MDRHVRDGLADGVAAGTIIVLASYMLSEALTYGPRWVGLAFCAVIFGAILAITIWRVSVWIRRSFAARAALAKATATQNEVSE